MPSAKEVFYVELPVSGITDKELQVIVASLAANGPGSALCMGNPVIQGTLTSVLGLSQTWTSACNAVAGTISVLATNRKARRANRKALEQKIQLFRQQVQDAAATPEEAAATGASVREQNALPTVLLVPEGGVLTPSKTVKGQFKANAAAVPGIRTFAVQISTDPVTPTSWVLAPGTGKTRKFSGYATGTRLWVRFASTRGQAQSDWSAPVSIVI